MAKKKAKSERRGKIIVRDDDLYIANDGIPFDRLGVLALCKANLSAKSADEIDLPIDDLPNVPNDKWISALSRHSIKKYTDYKNEIITDRRAEEGATKDYAGRWLFEILQNIDDAIGPKDFKKFIGTKGLGFLSILAVAHSPEIFSGPFNFMFSKKKTTELLIASGSISEKSANNPPQFQVPHPCDPNQQVRNLLGDGYATVIKLRIKPEKYEEIISTLKNLEPHFLMFAQHLSVLDLDVGPHFKKTFKRSIKSEDGTDRLKSKCDISITVSSSKSKPRTKHWVRWRHQWNTNTENSKQSSCAICLPLKNGACIPFDKKTNIYNFYPTEDSASIFAFLHITFQLSQDRKRLQMWGSSEQWDSKKCHPENLRLVSEFVSMIVDDVMADDRVSPATIIEVFQDLNGMENENDLDGKVSAKLQSKIIEAIQDEPFIPVVGGKKCRPAEAVLWHSDLINCFNLNALFGEQCLVSPEINLLQGPMQKFDAENISPDEVLDLLTQFEIKNSNERQRQNLFEVISSYCSDQSDYIRSPETFLKIPMFVNDEGKIVDLESGIFVGKKRIHIPSCFVTSNLDAKSYEHLEKFILPSVHVEIVDCIRGRFANHEKDFLSIHLFEELSHWNEDDWALNGLEVISFLFFEFLNNKRSIIDLVEANKDKILLPTERSARWENPDSIYFSNSWNISDALSTWFSEHHAEHEYLLVSRDTVLKTLKNFRPRFRKRKKNPKYTYRDVKELFQFLGVRDYPNVRPFQPFGVLPRRNKYYQSLVSHGLTRCYQDWIFYGIEDILNELISSERFEIISKMAVLARKNRGRYKVYGGRNYHTPNDISYALFQLKETKWVKLEPSPIRVTGLFSPSECYIDDEIDPIFPCVDRRSLERLLSKRKASDLLSILNIKDEFQPTQEKWGEWVNHISQGYRSLIDRGFKAEKLNGQVKVFFQKIFSGKNVNLYFSEDFKLPCKKIGKPTNELSFIENNRVFWNDTPLRHEQINNIEGLVDYGDFILGRIHVENIQQFEELKIKPLSSLLDRKTIPELVPDYKLKEIFNFLQSSWAIVGALDMHIGKNKQRSFKEFQSSLVLCENLSIQVTMKNKATKKEKPQELPIKITPCGDKKNPHKHYVVVDDSLSPIIQFLCGQFLEIPRSFSLMRDALNADTVSELRDVFESSGLDPDLANDYENLYAEKALSQREKDIEGENEKSKASVTPKDTNKTRKGSEKNKEGSDADNRRSEQENIDGLSARKPRVKNPNQRQSSNRSSFGRRFSGLIRAKSPNDINVRQFFDDEAGPENQKIGKVAEKFVYDLLVSEGKETVELIGGNNKGYDIEYSDKGQTNYVEVKGLKGSWDDSDVLLSKSQFERAQIEGERFWIYVVENVLEEDAPSYSFIRNPAKYFTKLQIDYGWRNFSPDKSELTPEKGRYVVVGDERLKITETKQTGGVYRLRLEGKSSPIIYDPNEMTIEAQEN